MTYHVNFDVRGIPKAQPRPRAFVRKLKEPQITKSGKTKTHVARVFQEGTPEKWKSDIVVAGKPWRPRNPLQGASQLRLIFWMPRPKRLMRKKDTDGPIPHLVAPDKENLEKPVMDAMKHDGWFRDDSQVFLGKTVKLYHAKKGAPGAEIHVDEFEEDSDTVVAAAIEMVRARL